jgi:hypothetical protein
MNKLMIIKAIKAISKHNGSMPATREEFFRRAHLVKIKPDLVVLTWDGCAIEILEVNPGTILSHKSTYGG